MSQNAKATLALPLCAGSTYGEHILCNAKTEAQCAAAASSCTWSANIAYYNTSIYEQNAATSYGYMDR